MLAHVFIIFSLKQSKLNLFLFRNNRKVLPDMNDVNPLRHYDASWHYQVIIFVKVVNDVAP